MTNRSTSKQHGLHKVKTLQPKSKMYKRRNKAKARARREEAQKTQEEALKKIRSQKAPY